MVPTKGSAETATSLRAVSARYGQVRVFQTEARMCLRCAPRWANRITSLRWRCSNTASSPLCVRVRVYFLQCLRNRLPLRNARCDRRLLLLGNGGSSALIDRDRDRGRDATFDHFNSEVVYLSKARQQAHSAPIFKRSPVDEAIL